MTKQKWNLAKVLLHTVICMVLYLLFSGALFLGLQVNPMYGNIGVLAVLGLIGLYVYWTLKK